MAYRTNEEIDDGFERGARLLCSPKNFDSKEVEAGRKLFNALVTEWGPVVDAYPSWHPLVATGKPDPFSPQIAPGESSGYKGLDHTVFLRNAFISCPYGSSDTIMESVRQIPFPAYVTVECKKLGVPLYHQNAKPILVTCKWTDGTEPDGMITKRYAIGAMLDEELACWKGARVAETWETMRPYFLGQPCGSKSSLFVNHETGQAMKRIWEAIVRAGVFGPIKGNQ